MSNNSSIYQINKSSEIKHLNNYNSNVSNYKFENEEFIVIDCPVHGKQTIKKSKLKKLGFN